jgi:hypothetical protein
MPIVIIEILLASSTLVFVTAIVLAAAKFLI